MNKLINFYNKVIEIGLLILVGIVPLIFEPIGFNPILIKTAFAHILIFTMFLAWLARSIEESEFKFLKTPLNFPLLLFFFTCIISFLFSRYKYASIRGLSDFFCYIMLFFIIVNNVHTINLVKRVIIVFLVSSAIVSSYGLLQHFGIDLIPWIRGEKIISSMGGSNFFAGYLIFVIPICLGLFFAIKSWFGKVMCAVLLFSFILCLVWTFIRSSWIGLAFSLLIFLIFKIKRTGVKNITYKNLLTAGVFFIIIITVICIVSSSTGFKLLRIKMTSIIPSAIGTIKEIPQLFLKPYQFHSKMLESPGARITIWQGAYRMFLSRPIFGHGVGTFEVRFPEYRPSFYRYKFGDVHTILHAHSEYLEILSEQGILGLGTFLWFIFVLVNTIFSRLNKTDEFKFNLTLGGICAIFSLLSEGFISVNLRWTSPALFFWLITGLIAVIPNEQLESRILYSVIKMNFTKRAKSLIFILLLIAGIFFWTNEINLFNSNTHLGQAVKFARDYKRPDISIMECKKSLLYEPTNIRALYFLGLSYLMEENWNEAKNTFLKVTRLAPSYHQVDYNLGVVYYHIGKDEESIKYLKKTAELDISNTAALNIINLLIEREKH